MCFYLKVKAKMTCQITVCRYSLPILKYILNEDYLADPKTFGERLRKARMDAGFKIKELAALIGVTEDTITNWELRGINLTAECIEVLHS